MPLFYPINSGNVRVVQRRQHPSFSCEPSETILVSGKRVGKDFDCDLAMQFRVGCAPHFAHTAFAQLREDLVGAEFVAWGKRHRKVG